MFCGLVALAVWIGDNLSLNLLMPIYPIDAVKEWRAAGHRPRAPVRARSCRSPCPRPGARAPRTPYPAAGVSRRACLYLTFGEKREDRREVRLEVIGPALDVGERRPFAGGKGVPEQNPAYGTAQPLRYGGHVARSLYLTLIRTLTGPKVVMITMSSLTTFSGL